MTFKLSENQIDRLVARCKYLIRSHVREDTELLADAVQLMGSMAKQSIETPMQGSVVTDADTGLQALLEAVKTHYLKRIDGNNARTNEGHHDSETLCQPALKTAEVSLAPGEQFPKSFNIERMNNESI